MIKDQLKAALTHEPGELQENKNYDHYVYANQYIILPPNTSNQTHELYRENICGVNVDMGKLKVPKDHNLVRTIVDGRSTTLMINHQFRLIFKPNPVNNDVYDVPMAY